MSNVLSFISFLIKDDSPKYQPIDNRYSAKETAEGVEGEHEDTDAENTPRDLRRARWKFPYYKGKLGFLVPSFLHAADPDAKPRALHPTAWLDGLRGIAAFFVVWHHSSLLWFSWHAQEGWRSPADSVMQLPLIRLVISGGPQVAVFFVVSGYALSYKPLRLMHAARFADAYAAVASSAFRRHTRLFLPPVATSFVAALLSYAGCYGTGGLEGTAVPARPPFRGDTLWRQLVDWAAFVRRFSDPLVSPGVQAWHYDENLWTLPVEFSSSLVVFLALLAFARLRCPVRLLFLAAVVIYALWYVRYNVVMFLGGTFLCDLHFYLGPSPSPPSAPVPDSTGLELPVFSPCPSSSSSSSSNTRSCPPHRRRRRRHARLIDAFWLVSFVGALYVLSMPEIARGAGESPGFRTLAAMVPTQYRHPNIWLARYFWLGISAVWLVFTVDRAPFLQRPFTTAFAQYLGRVSYALYLVHGTLLYTAGRAVGLWILGVAAPRSDAQYFLAICAFWLLFWPAAFWIADLAWRGLDQPSVTFMAWCYRRLTVKSNQH